MMGRQATPGSELKNPLQHNETVRRPRAKMDDKEKMNKIEKDILKSGMPLEVEISSLLRRLGWWVAQQATYLDRDKQEIRTIDITASAIKDRYELDLIVECKKSEKEIWTFHTQPKSSDAYLSLSSAAGAVIKLSDSKLDPGLFRKTHLANMNIKVGTCSYVPFKQRDSFFEAQQQVIKAVEYFSKEWGKGHLIYPVIVFDGEMYEFDIQEKGMTLEPIKYLQFAGSIRGRGTFVPCLIDVMNKAYFPDFLKIIKKESELLQRL